MNATPTPRPAEWQETEGLLPPVERDLPAGRHEFHKERLMAQIHEETRATAPTATTPSPAAPRARRGWYRRPAFLVPVAACALAGAMVTGVLVGQSEDTTPGVATGPVLTTNVGQASTQGAGKLLDRISLAAGETDSGKPRQDQFLYVKSMVAETHVKTSGDKHRVVSDEPYERHVWESPDGKKGRLVAPGGPEAGESLDGPYAGSDAYNSLAKLPTDPKALLKHIYEESKGEGNSRDQAAFEMIGEMIGESYPPPGVEAALYKAAARIPGVVMVEDAADVTGRHGVAVARLDKVSGERAEWIFDKKTHAFLGERNVKVQEGRNPEPEDKLIKRGTITFTSAVTKRAIVDEELQRSASRKS
ncbi:CU044_5270 family protein [Streptomyces sp. NPDC048172]|uniref:CU044_5270 family protein n=1 Tax=Streptomyces sp. NPDC048172 TaxID=3365505 RepID=UPI00371AD35E